MLLEIKKVFSRRHAADVVDSEPAWDAGDPDAAVYIPEQSARDHAGTDKKAMEDILRNNPGVIPYVQTAYCPEDWEQATASVQARPTGVIGRTFAVVVNGLAIFGQAYNRNNPQWHSLTDRPKNTP